MTNPTPVVAKAVLTPTRKRCSLCGLKVRGPGHANGQHHSTHRRPR